MDEFNSFVSKVNIYDIFGTCYGLGPYPQLYGAQKKLDKTNSWSSADYTPWLKRGTGINALPPCTWGTPLISYLNDETVKTSLHIPKEVQAWSMCTDDIHYAIQPKGSQWIYEALKGRY